MGIICALHVHCMCIACALHVHCMCIACVVHVHCICSACALHVQYNTCVCACFCILVYPKCKRRERVLKLLRIFVEKLGLVIWSKWWSLPSRISVFHFELIRKRTRDNPSLGRKRKGKKKKRASWRYMSTFQLVDWSLPCKLVLKIRPDFAVWFSSIQYIL